MVQDMGGKSGGSTAVGSRGAGTGSVTGVNGSGTSTGTERK